MMRIPDDDNGKNHGAGAGYGVRGRSWRGDWSAFMNRIAIWIGLPWLCAMLVSGCSGLERTQTKEGLRSTTGLASYYGNEFSGRITASGEKYDPDKLTAAHRSFPFGTRVRVTNLGNGKSVVVRINDRGPHKAGRIIDLSQRAAREIDLLVVGTAKVSVQVAP
jgi:rare lipoprotein A